MKNKIKNFIEENTSIYLFALVFCIVPSIVFHLLAFANGSISGLYFILESVHSTLSITAYTTIIIPIADYAANKILPESF